MRWPAAFLLGLSLALLPRLATAQEEPGSSLPPPPAGPSAPVKPAPWVWSVLPGAKLMFEGTQDGTPFRGSLPAFTGTLQFRPSDLGNSFIDLNIPLRNIVVDGYDRNSAVRTPEWLDTFQYPTARYVATQFRDEGQNVFTANGFLTLKGHTLYVPLRFQLTFEDVMGPPNASTRMNTDTYIPIVVAKRVHVKVLATIFRSQFGVGPVGSTNIGETVKVFSAFTAERPPVAE